LGQGVVLFADKIEMTKEAVETISTVGKIVYLDTQSQEELTERFKEATVVVSEYTKITRELINSAPMLKGIVVCGVGYDHIDVGAAREKKVYVTNTRGSNAEAVAELVFSFMLHFCRQALGGDHFIRKGHWRSQHTGDLPEFLLGMELEGKTLGTIGLGAIGRRVAQIGKCFGMDVLGHDPYLEPSNAEGIGIKMVGLEDLFRQADFVTIHVPATSETRKMVGSRLLNLMKKTAFFINCSRGSIVDEPALIEALRSRTIGGAALDVFEQEPLAPDSLLLSLDNVILTPHIGGYTKEAIRKTSLVVAEQCAKILKGEIPPNVVNKW